MTWDTCHAYRSCSGCQTHRLPNIKWRHSRMCFWNFTFIFHKVHHNSTEKLQWLFFKNIFLFLSCWWGKWTRNSHSIAAVWAWTVYERNWLHTIVTAQQKNGSQFGPELCMNITDYTQYCHSKNVSQFWPEWCNSTDITHCTIAASSLIALIWKRL